MVADINCDGYGEHMKTDAPIVVRVLQDDMDLGAVNQIVIGELRKAGVPITWMGRLEHGTLERVQDISTGDTDFIWKP
jgi:hypothetical protein